MTQDNPAGGEARPPTPPPARPSEPPPPASAPVSVRASLGEAHPGEDVGGPPPPAEVAVDAGGRRWTVRERGRSLGGPASAPVPLLLLGYFADPGDADPRLEALVVGRALSEVTHAALVDALSVAVPPSLPGAQSPFFPEIGAKGKRDQ